MRTPTFFQYILDQEKPKLAVLSALTILMIVYWSNIKSLTYYYGKDALFGALGCSALLILIYIILFIIMQRNYDGFKKEIGE
jgi:hypothetical protein